MRGLCQGERETLCGGQQERYFIIYIRWGWLPRGGIRSVPFLNGAPASRSPPLLTIGNAPLSACSSHIHPSNNSPRIHGDMNHSSTYHPLGPWPSPAEVHLLVMGPGGELQAHPASVGPNRIMIIISLVHPSPNPRILPEALLTTTHVSPVVKRSSIISQRQTSPFRSIPNPITKKKTPSTLTEPRSCRVLQVTDFGDHHTSSSLGV
jgi:hypothetical protein